MPKHWRRSVKASVQKVGEPNATVAVIPQQPSPVTSMPATHKDLPQIPHQRQLVGPKASPFKNPRLAVAAFVVRFNEKTDELELLLMQRWVDPDKGAWELPSGFIGHRDPAEEVARLLNLHTNLTATAVYFVNLVGKPGSYPNDHVVTFIFVVKVEEKSLAVKSVAIQKMNQDGSIFTEDEDRSDIDDRASPSWAWWYELKQVKGWLGPEKFEERKKEYTLPEIALGHDLLVSKVKEWWDEKNEKGKSTEPLASNYFTYDKTGKQPLNRGNSALTADIIVIKKVAKKFQIALIKRGQFPFKGKMAFPGGFINYMEDPPVGAVRELQEETFLTADPESAYLLTVHGHPSRDPRQHTITAVYVLKADPASLKKIAGGDDAADSRWYSLDEVFSWPDFAVPDPLSVKLEDRKFAFDHAVILKKFKVWWENEGEKTLRWYVEDPK